MDNNRNEWLREASSGREKILSVKWQAENPKAVLQIAHGMAEHTGRYNEFAAYMNKNGFSVYMNEHAGHGSHAETLGYFAEDHGMDYLVADMKSLDEVIRKENSGLPVFFLGHSMGSFLLRKYICLYGSELAGCILSGTAGSNPALGAGLLLSSLQTKIKGPMSKGRLLSAMSFGSYLKRIKNPVNANAWLSHDEDVCINYRNDKYCGFTFTAAGYHDLLELLKEINSQGWAEKVPKDLPIYIFSGAEDPVGNYGKGVIEVYDKLKKAGISDLQCKLYPGGLHEMLNEINKEEAYNDVLKWLKERVANQ